MSAQQKELLNRKRPAGTGGKDWGENNVDGHKGKICNNCGGYGFTMNIMGGKLDCQDCEGEGIALPKKSELLKRIKELEEAK